MGVPYGSLSMPPLTIGIPSAGQLKRVPLLLLAYFGLVNQPRQDSVRPAMIRYGTFRGARRNDERAIRHPLMPITSKVLELWKMKDSHMPCFVARQKEASLEDLRHEKPKENPPTSPQIPHRPPLLRRQWNTGSGNLNRATPPSLLTLRVSPSFVFTPTPSPPPPPPPQSVYVSLQRDLFPLGIRASAWMSASTDILNIDRERGRSHGRGLDQSVGAAAVSRRRIRAALLLGNDRGDTKWVESSI
ncbi:hypothetical protein Nepgr_031714 [Nepenthes gracilis]|uniref:Uncharacterized protein n=1 Tax=Nepenthes gracilis TaxID=150966 RepID=A0AAD3TJ10_NEPGR|nr:hypothetical protein Nepgr_031714 [Nepenthes gracilis]